MLALEVVICFQRINGKNYIISHRMDPSTIKKRLRQINLVKNNFKIILLHF